jgi:hypothetical protein
MDATKPYEFTGFGAMDATKPYEFIGFWATDATKPYEFIGFWATDATKPYEFIGFWAPRAKNEVSGPSRTNSGSTKHGSSKTYPYPRFRGVTSALLK